MYANFQSYLENKTLVYPNCYFPYFASDVAFEFYNDTNSPTVEFYYNGVLIPLCNGQDACSYDDFVFFARNATGNNTLETYFAKCGANKTMINQFEIKLGTETSNTVEEPFSIVNTDLRTKNVMIVGLSILCVFLLIQVIKDRRRYNKIVRGKKEDGVMQSEFFII